MFVNCLTEKVLPTEKQSKVPTFSMATLKSLVFVSSQLVFLDLVAAKSEYSKVNIINVKLLKSCIIQG